MAQAAIETTATVTPIFNGTERKPRRSRDNCKSPTELHPDRELIEHCMDFATYVASAKAAFTVDPTGNGDFGGSRDGSFRRKAQKSLEAATEKTTLTLDGLRAKASLVSIIFDDLCGSYPEDFHENFLRIFAADVIRFQQIEAPTDVPFHA